MIDIGFTSTESALLRSAQTLFVIAPKARLTKKTFPKLLDPQVRGLALELAADLEPGHSGAVASSLSGSQRGPRRVAVGALPDTVSRHNCPGRAEAVRSVVRARGADTSGKTAVLLLLDDADHYLSAANAVARALPIYSKKAQGQPKRMLQILAVDAKGGRLHASKEIKEVVYASRQAARLVDTPPSDLGPAALARQARALLKGLARVRITEIVGQDLLKNDLGGIHAVGRCAADKPRLLVASYTPARGKGRHVALVGKGITYDTGGLNLKTGDFMLGMKGDMGGAAAVLGAFRVLAATGCRHRLSLVLCIAENAIGPASYKPDDVLTMHSGKTVEINNTDAEGRLLLADGVSWAARKLGADHVLDAATLTGAQLISTGLLHAAIVSNDAELESRTVAAGQRSGDLCHPLIFAPELFQKEFASQIADMRNSVKNRKNAQSSCAAQFVWSHIDDTAVKWCHIDLAGPSGVEERGSGFGVALLAELIRELG